MSRPLENGTTALNNRLAVWWVPNLSGPLSRKTTGKHAVLFTGVNSIQDQIWSVKIGELIVFYVDRRS